MVIYFSGIGGVGIGPLAEIAHDAGYIVLGSDTQKSLMTDQLQKRGINIHFTQAAATLENINTKQPIDWLVYTAALPEDHPELVFARSHGIRVSKRDELLAAIIKEKSLKLIAVAGTHGKTTTTSMLIWIFQQLGIPVSYSVGTTLPFGPSGVFSRGSDYFIYECDEYDRNMLHFNPFLTVIPSLDYDHPDVYKNVHEYKDAFLQFMQQSQFTLLWEQTLKYLGQTAARYPHEAYSDTTNMVQFTLPGAHVRRNAYLAAQTIARCMPSVDMQTSVNILNQFPGTGRRFEKLADNLYTDYGHHPAEIAATLELARELNTHVVLVYQPHQNIRQHELQNEYTDCMELAESIYWLPTYLTREDPHLAVLTPEQLSHNLVNKQAVHFAELDNTLWHAIEAERKAGKLVLIIGAGTIDDWVRKKLFTKL